MWMKLHFTKTIKMEFILAVKFLKNKKKNKFPFICGPLGQGYLMQGSTEPAYSEQNPI